MARRGHVLGALTLWIALGSCTHDQAVADAKPRVAAVVVEHDATPSDRWVDFDIADTEEYSLGCAVDQLGALWCWGQDPTLQARLRPQLGPTEFYARQRSAPTRVEGVSAARAVAVSRDEVCRADTDGRVHCVRDDESKWRTIEGVVDAERIVVSELGGCAIQADRTLRCWTAANPARTLAQDVVDVTMDRTNACALRSDGEISCWNEESPPTSLGRVGNAIDIELDDHLWLLVLDAEGRVHADEVDDGEVEWIERRKLPGAVQLDLAPDHHCARTAEGAVQCYGANDHGQLGGGDSAGTEELVTMILEGRTAREVAVGHRRTCVRTADEILCVGKDMSAWAPSPGTVHQHQLDFEAVSLAAQADTTCAIDRSGDLRCWGGDFYLQPNLGIRAIATPTVRAQDRKALLGIHWTDDVLYWVDDGQLGAAWIGSPTRAAQFDPPQPQPQIHAFASDAFVCAIEAGARGRVATCGGAVEDRTPIAGIEGPTALATLGDQLCAIDRRAQVVCSPLAARYSARTPTPSVIAGVQNARSIAAMSSSRQVTMCAALESGRVLCWDGVTTQPSDKREEYVATPVADVGLPDAAALVGTVDWFCSLDRAGAVACWTPDAGRAAPEPGPLIDAEVVQLVAGRYHACALDRRGAVTCWGDESHGQLGRVPASVSLQPKPLVFAP